MYTVASFDAILDRRAGQTVVRADDDGALYLHRDGIPVGAYRPVVAYLPGDSTIPSIPGFVIIDSALVH